MREKAVHLRTVWAFTFQERRYLEEFVSCEWQLMARGERGGPLAGCLAFCKVCCVDQGLA
jgi:hypothetical protein